MIIVFGSMHIRIPLSVEEFAQQGTVAIANYVEPYPGGKGANQALAAARAGASGNVTLVGQTGDDEFSVTLLNSLRREGVTTSGVTKNDLPTGLKIFIEDGKNNPQVYFAPAANTRASADQVPDEVLSDDVFILIQTEITPDANGDLLEKAKNAGATTIMNLSPSVDIKQKTLDNLDYLIVNREEASALASKLNFNADDVQKMAEGFARLGNLNCIITQGAQGAVACSADGEIWSVEALPIAELVDRSGAEDSYCGAFVAALYGGLTLPDAMKQASIAASLTCTKSGTSNIFPTKEDIEDQTGNLASAVKL